MVLRATLLPTLSPPSTTARCCLVERCNTAVRVQAGQMRKHTESAPQAPPADSANVGTSIAIYEHDGASLNSPFQASSAQICPSITCPAYCFSGGHRLVVWKYYYMMKHYEDHHQDLYCDIYARTNDSSKSLTRRPPGRATAYD